LIKLSLSNSLVIRTYEINNDFCQGECFMNYLDIPVGFLSSFWEISKQMAPWLLFGFLVAGIMSELIPESIAAGYSPADMFVRNRPGFGGTEKARRQPGRGQRVPDHHSPDWSRKYRSHLVDARLDFRVVPGCGSVFHWNHLRNRGGIFCPAA
jgi:hypothetical protein